MIIISKILSFLGVLGKICCYIISLILIAMIIVSYKISLEETNNPYCLNVYQDEVISLEYEEIIEYTYKFECSTLYFDIKVIDNIDKNEIISLLIMIANDISEYECFTHFTIINNTLNNPLYASIDLKTMQVSYVN